MNIKDYITRSEKTEWVPLVENGVHYEGISVKSLRFDKQSNRSKSILLRFEKGATYPYHIHPAGEEIFILEGSCEIHNETLTKVIICIRHQKVNIVLSQKLVVLHSCPFLKKL